MTDDTDPASLAKAATADGDNGGSVPDPTGGEADAVDDAVGIVDLLLATEPDQTPEDYPELEVHTAHALIGLKKMANEALGGAIPGGTPAIENFIRAGVGFATSRSDDEQDNGGGWGVGEGVEGA